MLKIGVAQAAVKHLVSTRWSQKFCACKFIVHVQKTSASLPTKLSEDPGICDKYSPHHLGSNTI